MATLATRGTLIAALFTAAIACGAPSQPTTIALTRPAADAPFNGTFTWTTMPAAKTYNVVVFAPDGSRAFEVRDLKGGAVKLAESVQLPPGRYAVQVSAMRDGEAIAQTPRTEFDITR